MTRIKLILLFTCLTTVSAFSQSEPPETGISKGNWMIGGTAWFTEHASFNNIEYSIDPRAGYFLCEKFAIGLNVSYYFDGVENFQRGSIGPFARYYFINKRVAPFIEAEYNLGKSRYQLQGGDFETVTTKRYGAGLGLDVFITRNVAFEGTVKYLYNKEGAIADGKLGLNIGFQIFINRRK